MKLSIGSIKGLEQLITENDELIVEIKHRVLQDFSNKYIKGIVTADLKKIVKEEIKDFGYEEAVNKQLNETFLSLNIGREISKRINKEVEKQSNEIDQVIKERLVLYIRDNFSKVISNIFDEKYIEHVKSEIKKMSDEYFKGKVL